METRSLNIILNLSWKRIYLITLAKMDISSWAYEMKHSPGEFQEAVFPDSKNKYLLITRVTPETRR